MQITTQLTCLDMQKVLTPSSNIEQKYLFYQLYELLHSVSITVCAFQKH